VFFHVSLGSFSCCIPCFCCVGFSFFSTKPRDWLGRMSPKWPILCQVGRETFLINQLQKCENSTTLYCIS